uniref:Uncharacterized protein n=1 Tax=Rhizophora mucronata TaxID=61149 RepID=A0A2P2J195_RHIMU
MYWKLKAFQSSYLSSKLLVSIFLKILNISSIVSLKLDRLFF